MGRRILNRKDLRADYDAAERRKTEDEEQDEAEDEETDEEEEEEEGEAAESEEEAGDEEAEEAPPKKRKAPAKPKTTRTRSRAAKITRMKAVWGVFNNSNQRVAVFDYPKHQEALDLANKLKTEKRSTFFVQMVKEPMEEKKDE